MTTYSNHGNAYPANSVFLRDEYDFDDDHDDLEEERENEEPDESDEDTEEASESEMGKPEEYTEIKEQMYRDKLASYKKQLQQLNDGSHPDYNRKLKKLEANYKERLRLNIISRDYSIECIERDYVVEKRGAANDFEEKKIELRENLIADLEERRKQVEAERHTMELTGDPMEQVKPSVTRKLRRRPNDPIPVPEKRRKPPPAQVNYTLEDKEIDSDLKAIIRGSKMTQNSLRKPNMFSSSSVNRPPSPMNDSSNQDTRIEDGKLVYERRWFHRGQPVYAEGGKDMPRFAGNISAIGNDVIYVKKLDNSKVRIPLVYLVRGKVSIKRRAS